MTLPALPKISAHDHHRENLISFFLSIGTPLILIFAIFEWLNKRTDEAILDILLLAVLVVSAVIRKRAKNPQTLYRIVMIAFGLNFLYVLFTNQGIVPILFWHLVLPIPAVILLGIKEGLIWILAMGASIIAILNTPVKAPYINTEVMVEFSAIYLTAGLLSIFSEYVRLQTAQMLASRQADLEALNQTIMEKAMGDPLTHAFNRSYLSEILPGKISRAIQLTHPISIIIMDIDQFKNVNDSYGHTIGDNVLREVAATFRDQLRENTDDLIRLGGDEFMAVLPDTNLEDTVILAERLRQSVEKIENPEERLELTCSLGVVQLEDDEYKMSPEQAIRHLIKRGDECMYLAKRQGKNLVISDCEDTEKDN